MWSDDCRGLETRTSGGFIRVCNGPSCLEDGDSANDLRAEKIKFVVTRHSVRLSQV